MDCKVMGGEDVDWTDLVQDIKKWRTLILCLGFRAS